MKIENSRINVVTYPYWHYTFAYCLDSIAACGFRNIEFWAASPQYCYADYTAKEREERKKEIMEMLCQRNLAMPVFHPEQSNMYPLNIASPEKYIRDHSMQYVREYIDDAAFFGSKVMVLAPGRRDHDDENPDHYKRAVESIQALSEYAGQYKDLVLVIEEWPAYLCAFADNLQNLKKLLEDVNCANVKACLNTCSMHDNQETIAAWLQSIGDQLALVHFADTGAQTLGVGRDVAGDLAALADSGYEGTLSLNIQFRDCCVAPDKPVFASAAWLKRNGYWV